MSFESFTSNLYNSHNHTTSHPALSHSYNVNIKKSDSIILEESINEEPNQQS